MLRLSVLIQRRSIILYSNKTIEKEMVKSVGLTGSIGSGKTLVCSVFEHLGIPIFNADKEAKECYNDLSFLNEIEKEFGSGVVKEGKLVKENLANIVFNNKESLKKLNGMIHPKVLARYLVWKEEQQSKYVIHESAILFESGWNKYFDKIICINSPLDIIYQRVMQRDNLSKEEIDARLKNQMPIEEKLRLSDYIINHDNTTMLLPQILKIHSELIKE